MAMILNIKDLVLNYEIKEESILKSKNNYYIDFPRLDLAVEDWESVKYAPAIYEIKAKDNAENKQARLLLTLFEKKRYAVFLKTLSWFRSKYPESEYNEVIDFMAADVHYAIWEEYKKETDFDQALILYKQAMDKYPNSELVERTSLKLGLAAYERHDYMSALRLFKAHKDFLKSGSFSKDLAQLGMGLCYFNLNKFSDAISEYQDLQKNSNFEKIKAEAAYRIGDVHFKAKDFSAAVEEYQKAIKSYPQKNNLFPNAYFNQAEAYFKSKKFKEALRTHQEFVQKFPKQTEAALSMTRMGEILEILGASAEKVEGAFLETYFRFGESSNAVVARLRMISKKMHIMKPTEVEKATSEIMTLAKKMKLDKIEEFATIMIADGYNSRLEFEKSIQLLSQYYKSNPLTVDTDFFSKRIIQNISDMMMNELKNKNFISTLKIHNKYADNWLKSSARRDIRYFLGLSYEMAGVSDKAEKYYKEVLNEIYSLKGSSKQKEVAVSEHLPTADTLNLRLAKILLNNKKYQQSYEYIKQIQNTEKLTESEQIERIQLSASLMQKKEDFQSATRYLTELLKNWKGQPAMLAEPYLQLAEIEILQKKSDEAEKSLLKIDELKSESPAISNDLHFKALQLLSQLQLKKDEIKGADTLQKMLSLYETEKPLSSTRYQLGEIFFKKGDLQKAQEVWNGFKGANAELWQKLAQEQLTNNNWKQSYKKYINRIPAMAGQQKMENTKK
ncbi:MAG: tetratricopeptide repeat protein [Pseudobdellovibrionaceae bacterium]